MPKDRQYVGFDAYKNVIDQVDVVILTTTPHFRPIHFAYAVEKGVHSFVEKPVATDAPGVRAFLAACEQAKKKNLSVVSGLCWRYDDPRRATMSRVLEGAIGDIVAVETTYNSHGVWDPRKSRGEVGSEMEYQMRNWYYYDWLSGDHIVEQAVHGLDTMAWALGDKPPIQCWGSGGRQVRTDPMYGNIYDHFSIVYEYPNNVRGYHQSRHWTNCDVRVKDFVLGSKGVCDVFGSRISGAESWRYRSTKGGKPRDMYQNEHDELFASIRGGKAVNNGQYAADSTMLAIMGRMAAYTGKTITWEMAMNSKEDLSPAQYAWGDAPPPRAEAGRHPVRLRAQGRLSSGWLRAVWFLRFASGGGGTLVPFGPNCRHDPAADAAVQAAGQEPSAVACERGHGHVLGQGRSDRLAGGRVEEPGGPVERDGEEDIPVRAPADLGHDVGHDHGGAHALAGVEVVDSQ